MSNERKKIIGSKWFNITVTTIISIIITAAFAWYQISQSEEQEALANLEKEKNVRQEIVSIVEEHIINTKPIDIGRLSRLIDLRRREENLNIAINVYEIIERAEFNILNTRYLDFPKKHTYKVVFDSIYFNLTSGDFIPFSEHRYSDQLNQLAKSIQEGKTKESLENLRRIASTIDVDFESVKKSESDVLSFFEIYKKIFTDPWLLMTFIMVYAVTLFIVFPRFRDRVKRAMKRKIRTDE